MELTRLLSSANASFVGLGNVIYRLYCGLHAWLYDPHRRHRRWGILCAALWSVGFTVSFLISTDSPGETTEARLATFTVIGLILAGVAQLARGSAHGLSSDRGKLVDGWGKALGVLGWSVGVSSALLLRFGPTPDWVLDLAIWAIVVAPLTVLFVAIVLPLNKKDDGAGSDRPDRIVEDAPDGKV